MFFAKCGRTFLAFLCSELTLAGWPVSKKRLAPLCRKLVRRSMCQRWFISLQQSKPIWQKKRDWHNAEETAVLLVHDVSA